MLLSLRKAIEKRSVSSICILSAIMRCSQFGRDYMQGEVLSDDCRKSVVKSLISSGIIVQTGFIARGK